MLLACDIGNTSIKAGLFLNNKIIEFTSFNNLKIFVSHFKSKEIDQVAISSVVPKLTEELIKVSRKFSKPIPFIIDIKKKFNLKINYDSLKTLGIDRICSAEGAFGVYKNSDDYKSFNDKSFIISIDFGTATTVNIVKYPGEFIGGIISPGIKMMFDSLNTKTAQLPNVSESDYKDLIGKNTFSSIASGVINSSVGLIEKTIAQLKSEKNAKEVKIFITGGNAERILPFLKFDYEFVRELVLIGVKAVFDINH